jgi:hypothetical protein
MPLEVAIARSDDILHLLVELGADVNVPMHKALEYDWQTRAYLSLYDFVRLAREYLEPDGEDGEDDKSKTSEQESSHHTSASNLSSCDSWKSYFTTITKLLSDIQNRRSNPVYSYNNTPTKPLPELREYIEEADQLFTSSNAKTWAELYPDKPSTDAGSDYRRNTSGTRRAQTQQKSPGYKRAKQDRGDEVVPAYLVSAYDKLFEACWNGDDDTIRQLCLPNEARSDQKSLVIAASAVDDTRYGEYNSRFMPSKMLTKYV